MVLSIKEKEENGLAPHPVLTEYYQTEGERRKLIDNLFDVSAGYYDAITHMMSFGSGGWYRQQALERAGLQPGMRVLDIGTGTGALARMAQTKVGEAGSVVALDPSRGMLVEAKKQGVQYAIQALGEQLPFQEGVFNIITMGYALRHVADLKPFFSECHRVLKPGGKLLLLEVTRPKGIFLNGMLKFYLKGIVPMITRLLSRCPEAQKIMRYFWDTIETCVSPETILATMQKAGFGKTRRDVVLGIFSEYNGIKAYERTDGKREGIG